MSQGKKLLLACMYAIVIIGAALILKYWVLPPSDPAPSSSRDAAATANESKVADASSKDSQDSFDNLVKRYGDIPLIDAHNHSASNRSYDWKIDHMWDKYRVDRVVLFGNVSEPSAIQTDQYAWEAYQQYPERFVPFFSGIDLHDPASLDMVKEKLEQGYFSLGELAAASTYSPVLANVAWKTEHPMDGIFPQLYELCAAYNAPLLLHIDPPNGMVITKLEEALKAYPDTTIIFAHANAYNSPENIRMLLEKYPNLYADFFAGFTAFNPESVNKLVDFVPVIKDFPDRFLLSTDSGFGLAAEEQAIEAMYQMMDALQDRELATKIASGNMERLIRSQKATATQITAIQKLDRDRGQQRDVSKLTKEEAGNILIEEGTQHQ
ncbi:amidohydrolase family protein [Paenibacillus sp. OSY-SE]|uniref:amidohydrolase family protein n=1 Tax=Paenibacillus sp. OSY-SE TaxID=1196323 RepID=UPI0002F8A13E|nr:amidohydrolase family protein [Paenibacillus sp. OSY-SE]